MPNWKSKVALSDLHQQYEAGELAVQEVAAKLVERLKLNKYASEIEDLIEELERVATTTEEDFEGELQGDYDCILEELYDFGDNDHRIWFEAFA